MKTISIIIPAYNAARYIQATLMSCLHQTIKPYQIIVVDDGSSDETQDVVVSLGKEIEYVHIENSGVSRARNIGAERARGEWLLFLDADDLLLSNALEVLLTRAKEQQAGVVYGMVIERRESSELARLNGFNFAAGDPPHGAERNFWRCAIATPGSAIVKASLHKEVGGFITGYEPMEDRDYWIKCGLLERIIFCDTVVLDKKWYPASHGSQHSKRIYRGQLALRALKVWASNRDVVIDWMPSDRTIVRSALDEAVWRRRYDILKPLLKEGKKMSIFHWKALILSFLFAEKIPSWVVKKL